MGCKFCKCNFNTLGEHQIEESCSNRINQIYMNSYFSQSDSTYSKVSLVNTKMFPTFYKDILKGPT